MSRTAEILKKLKEKKPLVHHITNWVTIYDCANVVRTIGALPVMAHAKEEAAEMAGMASALVLNIGTLTGSLVESMKLAGKAANVKNVPVVLDAVGAGATGFRDEKSLELIRELHIDIIKGNRSEIAKLSGMDVFTKGVESTEFEGNLEEIARKLACKRNSTVVITGREDIIADRDSLYICRNGHPMMGSIVGTGCMAASIIGAFAAVEKDYALAAAAAMAVFGIAGELAAEKSEGPGTFKEQLYNALYKLGPADIEKLEKLEEKAA